MVILSAITMVVTVLSGFVLLLSTDFAEQDPSNADVYVFTSVIGVGCTAIWTVLNLTLLALRRQTGGQYVAGIRLARSDGKPLSLYDLLSWWACFNPLLFSWPVAAVVGFAVLLSAGLLDSRSMLALGFFVIFVCLAAPIASAVSALFDAQNRGLHDRTVGTIVVPA